MKPGLGRKVYCICSEGILVDTVKFIGQDSFIINSFGEETEPDSWEWSYDTYNEEWFTNLSEAKKKLINILKDRYEEKFQIVQKTDAWYMVEFCE